MYKPGIILEGAPNARDLGGIETLDGRKLKYNRLIRSGTLGKITDKDIEYLKTAGLNKVVDFRTGQEIIQKPDRIIEGVEYIKCPILERKTEGITREVPETEDEEAQRTVKMAQRLMSHGRDGREKMKSLYTVLVSEEIPLSGYRKFFDILLKHENGALLYHCSLGKDRVGTATALILSALNVPRETIISDYLISRERCADATERLIKNCRRYTDDEEMLEFIYLLDIVEADFIGTVFETADKLYGGMDKLLRDKIGLSDEKRLRLCEMYLD